MRIKVNYKTNNAILDINNQHILNSYIHKCLGKDNKYHDTISNYSISHLCGGKLYDENNIIFKNNAFIIISSNDFNFINDIIIGINNIKNINNNIIFNNIEFISETFYNGWNHFATLSPILIKKSIGFKKHKFITIKDDNFKYIYKEYLIKIIKSTYPNENLDNLDIIINDNINNKTKKITVNNVINIASVFQFSVKCNKKIADFLYNNGIGVSRGSGFGTIYKTENIEKYKF